MSPARRRVAVAMLCDRLHVSERWACQVCGQHRSTQRREPTPAGDDAALRGELRAFSAGRPRWGFRQAHTHLLGQGWEINRKRVQRVQRVWREEGLRVPQRTRKRRRLGDSTVPAERLRSERPDHVWAFDFQFDQTADGKTLTKIYSAKATLIVAQSGNPKTFDAVQAAQAVVRTYADLLESPNIAQLVADRVDDGLTATDVERFVVVESIPETQLLSITAEGADPERAKQIANAYAAGSTS